MEDKERKRKESMCAAEIDIDDLDEALGVGTGPSESEWEATIQRRAQELAETARIAAEAVAAKEQAALTEAERKKAQRIAKAKETKARNKEAKRIKDMRDRFRWRHGSKVDTMTVDELEKLVEHEEAVKRNRGLEKKMIDEIDKHIPLYGSYGGIKATCSLTGVCCLNFMGTYCERYGTKLNSEYISGTRTEWNSEKIAFMDFRVPDVKTPEELSQRLWLFKLPIRHDFMGEL